LTNATAWANPGGLSQESIDLPRLVRQERRQSRAKGPLTQVPQGDGPAVAESQAGKATEQGGEHHNGDPGNQHTEERPRPVIIRFANFPERQKVLDESRMRRKGNVSQDYTERVRDMRRNLRPHLIAKREQFRDTEVRVYMDNDRLVVGRKRFVFDNSTMSLKEVQGRVRKQ
jgi:hypothetical protein